MMRVIDMRHDEDAQLPRPELDITAALAAVEPIMADVRERGALAVHDCTERFDRCTSPSLRVPAAVLQRCLDELDTDVRDALQLAIKHVRAGHEAQVPPERDTEIVTGGHILQRWIPVQRVGLYVPGGLAVYPSSVVMNAVAAQVAGVESIALASPANPSNGGYPHPVILAACQLLGITEVYAAGGAAAIGLFAYGSSSGENVTPVDVITGPGNIYVAAAKRIAASTCGIDAEAGTTEIAIVADSDANPRYLAFDLVSQAEHDPAAASVLFTDSAELISEVQRELTEIAGATRHSERVKTALSGPQSALILTRDTAHSLALADRYGAEHLEIHTRDSAGDARKIRNAGAIFVGPYTPVPLGDYLAGSNHVLPTGGTARFRSGLSVMAFLKAVQVIEYDQQALTALAPALRSLAEAENLPAHADAADARQ